MTISINIFGQMKERTLSRDIDYLRDSLVMVNIPGDTGTDGILTLCRRGDLFYRKWALSHGRLEYVLADLMEKFGEPGKIETSESLPGSEAAGVGVSLPGSTLYLWPIPHDIIQRVEAELLSIVSEF